MNKESTSKLIVPQVNQKSIEPTAVVRPSKMPTIGKTLKEIVKRFCYFDLSNDNQASKKVGKPKIKVCHTIIGITLLLIAEFIPFWGFISPNQGQTVFSLVQSKRLDFTGLARSALMVAPILSNMISQMLKINFESRSQRQKFSTGMKHVYILVQCWARVPWTLWYYEWDQDVLFLYPEKWAKLFVFFIHPLQCTIVSWAILHIEKYIEDYSYGRAHVLFYYQFSEFLTNISSKPMGIWGFRGVLYACGIILFTIYIQKAYQLQLAITPVTGSTQQVTPIKLKCMDLISNVILIVKIMKAALSNLVTLMINPLLRLKGQNPVPEAVIQNPFFLEDYYLLWSLPNSWFSKEVLVVLYCLTLESLGVFFLVKRMYFFVPTYSYKHMCSQLEQNKVRLEGTLSWIDQQKKLKKQMEIFLHRTAIMTMFFMAVLNCLPLASVVLKGSVFFYFYAKAISLVEGILSSDLEDLPYIILWIRAKVLTKKKLS